MILFELRVNGKLVARAGADALSVLSHTVTARGMLGTASAGTSNVKEGHRLEASLTGLTSRQSEPKNVHVAWYSNRALSVGDELSVRIVEGTDASEPQVLAPSEG
jgi:hypothetical protein